MKLKEILKDGEHVLYDPRANQLMAVWKSNCYPDYSVSYVFTNDQNASMYATEVPLKEFKKCEYIGSLDLTPLP